MNNHVSKPLLAGISVAAAAVCGGTFAQTSNTVTLEEIVVTASRREVALQDLPMTVSAVTAQRLEEVRARATEDYILTVPGVSFTDQGAGRESFVIRGISSLGSSNTTARYIDETPLETDIRLFDIDRVEVLRGPQGTLYGVSSMGGAIRTITRKPNLHDFEARFDGSLTSLAHGGLGGDANMAINLPLLEDTLALRMVGFDEWQSGYIDNYRVDRSAPPTLVGSRVEEDADDAEFRGGRVMLRWTPSDATTVDAALYYQDDVYDAVGSEDQDLGAGKLRQGRHFNEENATQTTQGNLTIRHQLGIGELLSSTTYLRARATTNRDFTDFDVAFLEFANLALGLGNGGDTSFITPLNVVDNNENISFTQELRLSSIGEGRLSWVIGAFYTDRDLEGTQIEYVPGASSIFGPFTPNDTLVQFYPNQALSETSMFAEANYNLTSKWQATVGVRRYQLKSSFDQTVQSMFNVKVDEVLNGDTSSITEFVRDAGKADESGFTYKFLLSYAATDALLFYAGASSGYRPGGPNAFIPPGETPTPSASYTTDKLWQYELGAKSTWYDGRLLLNAAVFDIDWTDIQTAIATDGGFAFLDNAGAAHSRGVELELRARSIKGLDIGMSATWLEAEFAASFPLLNVESGDRLPNIPEFQGNLDARYSWPAFGAWNAYVYSAYTYVGGRVNNANQAIDMPGYDRVDARVGLDRGDWGVSVFINNATDERGVTGFENYLGYDRTHYAQPRTIGVALHADF